MASNYRAAKRGRSRAEFNAKLGTVVEEADETVVWLEYLRDGKIAFDEALLLEAQALRRIFGKSLGTARRNAGRRP
jgi:four helix bundle protein